MKPRNDVKPTLWGGSALLLSLCWIAPSDLLAQSLPPIPIVPSVGTPPTPRSTRPTVPQPALPQPTPPLAAPQPNPAAPPAGTTATPLPKPRATEGKDLQQVVKLFINDSLDAGKQASAVNYNELSKQLIARSYGSSQPQIELEYDLIRSILKQYGDPADRLLTPTEFRTLLNRPRPPLQARSIAPRVGYLAIPELTPATAQEVRQTLYTQDYSRGLVVDLRGSVGYDPQVVADVARLFLPRSITPLVITQDRFGESTAWDSQQLPMAAGVPVAVLVDGSTRQGSALLAAQLGVSGNTILLGQPTAGTERQTKFFLLPSGAAVELAIARWQTGDQRPLDKGVVPLQTASGPDGNWLSAGIQALSLPPRVTTIPRRPSIYAAQGRIGRFELGQDTRNIDTSLLGNVDSISRESGRNVFQPNSDLKIFYLQDYMLFTYRNRGSVDSFFADRIYTTDPSSQTAEGITLGSTYSEVIRTYGKPGENGYNEIMPFPVGSREFSREGRYYLNYDATGISFIFEVGSNKVVAIGLFKPGS